MFKLEHFSQDDPDAYSYSGALCKANQGVMEFVRCSRRQSRYCTSTSMGNTRR
ncbi:hypothetical protein O9929_10705 [Vibrio lentus]|nr:hypothetical protein [Vibrio lentus]